MEAGVEIRAVTALTIRQTQVLQTKPEGERAACILNGGGRVLVSNLLAAHIRPGDEINFPVVLHADVSTEIYIRKTSSSARSHDVYQGPIGYTAQPKKD